jgi:hypothetical protein
MKRLRSLLAITTMATLLAAPVSSVTAAQPVSVGWCMAPGNTITLMIGWPPNWSPVLVDVSGMALGVGDSVHEPDGNPVTVKGSGFTFAWVTAWPEAEHFASIEMSGRFDKNGGPQESFVTTIQGVVSNPCPS